MEPNLDSIEVLNETESEYTDSSSQPMGPVSYIRSMTKGRNDEEYVKPEIGNKIKARNQ